MEQRLRGSRNPARWGLFDLGAKVAPSGRHAHRVVGRCRICGQDVRWGQSYHRNGLGLAHLRCEGKKRRA